MLYKAFLIATVVGCSAALGIMGERQVLNRKEILKDFLYSIRVLKQALLDQEMILSEALIYCGKKDAPFFLQCGELVKKYPKMGAEQVVMTAMTQSGGLKELEKEDIEILKGFMENVFSAVSGEEVVTACARFHSDVTEVIRDIDDVKLKKARLKKIMFILGGIAVSIVLV